MTQEEKLRRKKCETQKIKEIKELTAKGTDHTKEINDDIEEK